MFESLFDDGLIQMCMLEKLQRFDVISNNRSVLNDKRTNFAIDWAQNGAEPFFLAQTSPEIFVAAVAIARE